eukprot:m.1127028 g.1127028  ORF g.1127028 m.1127028 type:complete len:368 (+) comp24412_c0_seq72:2124-3227(+)
MMVPLKHAVVNQFRRLQLIHLFTELWDEIFANLNRIVATRHHVLHKQLRALRRRRADVQIPALLHALCIVRDKPLESLHAFVQQRLHKRNGIAGRERDINLLVNHLEQNLWGIAVEQSLQIGVRGCRIVFCDNKPRLHLGSNQVVAPRLQLLAQHVDILCTHGRLATASTQQLVRETLSNVDTQLLFHAGFVLGDPAQQAHDFAWVDVMAFLELLNHGKETCVVLLQILALDLIVRRKPALKLCQRSLEITEVERVNALQEIIDLQMSQNSNTIGRHCHGEDAPKRTHGYKTPMPRPTTAGHGEICTLQQCSHNRQTQCAAPSAGCRAECRTAAPPPSPTCPRTCSAGAWGGTATAARGDRCAPPSR